MSLSPLIQIGSPRTASGGIPWQERLQLLEAELRRHSAVVVAYSGGVDSSLVLRVAHHVLGGRAHGVIGRSDSYARRELELAIAQAASFGAEVEIVSTGELSDPNFRSNPLDRCYHCKSELYRELSAVAERIGAEAILDGTIVDDLTDWRPGRKAANERGVRSPLAELGFTKDDVRAAASHFGLASHDKPASPCLASRIPYGTEITAEALSQVERGEELLHSLGFAVVRVRHFGATARIEVPTPDLARLWSQDVRPRLLEGLVALGFREVHVDLEGFRSGNLNRDAARAARGVAEAGEARFATLDGPGPGRLTQKEGTAPPASRV